MENAFHIEDADAQEVCTALSATQSNITDINPINATGNGALLTSESRVESPRVVVVGGGHGAALSISTALSLGCATSAVVAMADDGGSTGILRQVADATPPGDIRNCLVAFARDSENPLTKAFRYRFPFADNHALGNLVITALEDASGSFMEAIRIVEELLDARGHVYPSTLTKVELLGRTVKGEVVRGQANACSAPDALHDVWLKSNDAIVGYAPAIEAIEQADVVLIGPGSLFTSLIPNILIPEIAHALNTTKARLVFACPVADAQGETRGLSALEYLDVFVRHGLTRNFDYVIMNSDTSSFAGCEVSGYPVGPIVATKAEMAVMQHAGTQPLCAPIVNTDKPFLHNPAAFRELLKRVVDGCPTPQM